MDDSVLDKTRNVVSRASDFLTNFCVNSGIVGAYSCESRNVDRLHGVTWNHTVLTERLWEIDALRGIAIVMVIIYHLMYDLYFFGVTNAIFTDRFWFYFQRVTASTFIILVGISLAVRAQKVAITGQRLTINPLLRRGLTILAWGMIITLVTRVALGPDLAIRFGILHFIGVSVIIVHPFVYRRRLNLVLGLAIFVLGKIVQQISIEQPWLLWLGVEPNEHIYVDYFPLLPWFGVVLIGIWLGHTFYQDATRRYQFPNLKMPMSVSPLIWLGRHSLTIYMIHQPLLLAVLTLLLSLAGLGNLS